MANMILDAFRKDLTQMIETSEGTGLITHQELKGMVAWEWLDDLKTFNLFQPDPEELWTFGLFSRASVQETQHFRRVLNKLVAFWGTE